MMYGVLDFLTSEDPDANVLRDRYIFKVVPMLNPDGVINGNYRCSLVGADLNRRWKNPQVALHPIIYQFKRVIKNTAANYDIDLICDLHGHSRKKNIFIYGCNIKKSPQICKIFPGAYLHTNVKLGSFARSAKLLAVQYASVYFVL